MSDPFNLLEEDRLWVWHPFSPQKGSAIPLPVVRAEGAYLYLENGQRLLDGISSWWVNLHGHAQPEIARAISEQAQTLEHVIFAGFTHRPAVELARTLVLDAQRAGMSCAKIFYSDNGSTAVEVALKLAYQFHVNRGDLSRTRFLALHGAYHGDTFGAMSVGEPEGYHAQFRELLAPVDFVALDDSAGLKEILLKNGHRYAAMIVEPMLQGAGGMKMYDADFLKLARELCSQQGIPLICDEVFTGFHRTGPMYAFEHAGINPDLVCLSKGITGGFLALGATLCSTQIHEAFAREELSHAFLHGHSYTANPLACAAALASWKILSHPDCQARIQAITRITAESVSKLKNLSQVKSVRSLGTIGAIELLGNAQYGSGFSTQLRERFFERGILLRPLGNTIYTAPPYCITDQELRQIFDIVKKVIHETSPA